MKAMRLGLLLAIFTGAGFLLGGSAVYTWERAHQSTENEPQACWEATVYLPMVDNEGRRFTSEEFQAALSVLVNGLGGATLIEEREGYWLDGGNKLCREPVRPVLVSFHPGRLDTFRSTVREVGRRLGQAIVYYRLEKLHVEMLTTQD